MFMKIYEAAVLCGCLSVVGVCQAPEMLFEIPEELPEPIIEETLLDASEVACLQKNIYFEARNQGVAGMKAVAAVTLNRVEDPRFPNTICEVVYQRRQFSWANRGDRNPILKNSIEQNAWKQAEKIAEQALIGNMMEHGVESAQYFHTISISPSWNRHFEHVATIGDHMFYYQPLKNQ